MDLVCLAKIVDHQVLLEADLRDPSREGSSVRFAHHLHPHLHPLDILNLKYKNKDIPEMWMS